MRRSRTRSGSSRDPRVLVSKASQPIDSALGGRVVHSFVIVFGTVICVIPFAAALIVGLRTGRITPAAWGRLDADQCSQPIRFWLLVALNTAMSAGLIYACVETLAERVPPAISR